MSPIHSLNVNLEKNNFNLKVRNVELCCLCLLVKKTANTAERFNDKFVVRFSYKISQVRRSRSHNYSNYVVVAE